MYKTRIGIICLVAAGVAMLTGCGEKSGVDRRPNFVLILADDLGYSDLGCYGGEIATPNIDSLAANGLRYRQFYNTARSSPSRASLLTGLTPHLADVGHGVVDHGYPGYRGTLATNTVTLAEALKAAGYQTAMAGKWHVTNNTQPDGDRSQWPVQRGFDRFYGTLSGHGSFWDPNCLYNGNIPVRASGDYYYTEALTEHARRYIGEMARAKEPFFLYVAYTAPHYPLHARPEYIEKYRGRYATGWDSLRLERFERMRRMGVLPPDAVLPEKNEQCCDWADEPQKEWQQRRMEVYAAMVEQMDAGVGELVAELRRKGVEDNTLIIFLSDNGASNEGHIDNTVERTGAHRGDPMIPDSTRDGRPVRSGDIPGLMPGPDDTYGSYGPQWAHLSSTPFRGYKSWMHEGGICTPMILSWGDRIADKGAFRDGVFTVTDFMPTLLELAGSIYPYSIRGQRTVPIEGRSFAASLAANTNDMKRMLFWEHEGNRAVRRGRWKLVSEYPDGWRTLRGYPTGGAWELYDLEADRTETRDLASENPELVAELAAAWEAWAARAQVKDWASVGSEKW